MTGTARDVAFPPPGGAFPPLDPLREVVGALERSGVTCALGGSGLLAALGLADRAGDWDLTTDDGLERVRESLGARRPDVVGPGGLHADRKIALPDARIEIIVGFAIRSAAGTARIPTIVTGRRSGIPLGSPEAWAVAYALLGRPEKSERLFAHLRDRGADPGVLARLAAQPLPAALRGRLADLPRPRR